MTEPEEHDDRDEDPLDDALDEALDGGFAAAKGSEDPEPGQSVLKQIEARTGARPSVSLREVGPGQLLALGHRDEVRGQEHRLDAALREEPRRER